VFPVEWRDFVREQHGYENFEEIRRLANSVRKYTKDDKRQILEHLKAQHKYIERRRMEGEQGFIDWAGWD
jgi:hypothetical protein